MKINTCFLWVDGSVYPSNPGSGGWGACGIWLKETSGFLYRFNGIIEGINISSNSAELEAIIRTLDFLKPNTDTTIRVYTDSNYIIRGLTKLEDIRQTRKNIDIWLRIKDAVDTYTDLSILKVNGHKGIYEHDIAHSLAYLAASQRKLVKEIREIVLYDG